MAWPLARVSRLPTTADSTARMAMVIDTQAISLLPLWAACSACSACSWASSSSRGLSDIRLSPGRGLPGERERDSAKTEEQIICVADAVTGGHLRHVEVWLGRRPD